MQKLLAKIKEALILKFSDADEAYFCRRWMLERAYGLVKTGYVVAIPMNILALLLFPLFTSEHVRPYFNTVHATYLGVLLLAGFFYKKPRAFVNILCLSTIVFVVSYSYGMHLVWELGEQSRALRVTLGVATMGMFSLQLLPTSPLVSLLCMMSYTVGAYVSLLTIPTVSTSDSAVIATIMMVVFGFSLLMRLRIHFTSLREAQNEYQTRLKIAPAHILRKSLERSADIDTVFAPKRKFCACISSDWRSYQQLSSSLTSTQLAEALSFYYDECEKILHQVFPAGNYFSDWIADELFVVAYASKGMNAEQLADAALRFSQRLIVFKQGFYEEYQFPAAIDVGVSVGDALLGMMGPQSYRKATALGRVPGEARRLQTIGKDLRERVRPTDRVVFNRAVFTQLKKANLPIKTIQSTEVTSTRDLDDRVFYYVEPVLHHLSFDDEAA